MLLAIGMILVWTSWPARLGAQQATAGIGEADLGGLVTGANGPEAGEPASSGNPSLGAQARK